MITITTITNKATSTKHKKVESNALLFNKTKETTKRKQQQQQGKENIVLER